MPYPLHKAPSQRFRVENLTFLLNNIQRNYNLVPFLDDNTWQILYKEGSLINKIWGILKSFGKRWYWVLFKAYKYQYIFIHREAAPLGPPIVEWYLSKILHKKIIYDYDDAIWIPNTSNENKIAALVKAFWKVKYICKWSYKISAGNDFLCQFAKTSGAQNIIRIPTVVNTHTRYNVLKEHHNSKVNVGWTGSHSTLKFLDAIIPIIQKLQEKINFNFCVIADKKPDLPLKNWTFYPWNEKTEIEDLLQFDIGIMPLIDDAWSEGKCGFKLIQYLSLGIPAIANPVGVNKQIIEHGINGFLVNNDIEWEQCLETLIANVSMRESMGKNGRNKIINEYSIESIKDKFVELFS